jgi:hypothetical protein
LKDLTILGRHRKPALAGIVERRSAMRRRHRSGVTGGTLLAMRLPRCDQRPAH